MKDNLEKKFRNLKNPFDTEEPTNGHFNRFKSKLNKTATPKKRFRLLSYVAVAASIVLLFGIWIGAYFSKTGMELAGISPKMEETQSYFIATIEKELEIIENERSEDTEHLINDAFEQLNKLETQYSVLTLELKESTEDKRIIYAMISNFQQRIDILHDLLNQIETIKQLKTQNNENFI
ncbi:hypothetical protein [Lutibacter sp.]